MPHGGPLIMSGGPPAPAVALPYTRLSISGATLASLLATIATAGVGPDPPSSSGDSADVPASAATTACSPCVDGLLFGHVRSSTHVRFDDAAESSRDEHEAHVTGYSGAAEARSFFDAAGRVQPGRLRAALAERGGGRRDGAGDGSGCGPEGAAGGGELLGWFSVRPGGPLLPSLREAAVSDALLTGAFLPAGRPALLCILSLACGGAGGPGGGPPPLSTHSIDWACSQFTRPAGPPSR